MPERVENRPRIVHLLPADGIGGVEAAARSLDPERHPGLAVYLMAGSVVSQNRLFFEVSPRHSVRSPLIYFRAVCALLSAAPEVLVCSLWRSTLTGLLLKLVRPRTRLVVMIHSTRVAHFVDRVVSAVGCRVAEQVWSDSRATQDYVLQRYGRASRVISFMIPVLAAKSATNRKGIDVAFWGRHVPVKDIPRAVRIFGEYQQRIPEAKFYVYGAEGESTPEIRAAIAGIANPAAVVLKGEKPPGEYPEPIASCAFFLMSSTREGMAISVVEAMQIGLIPVVTGVGEIPNYCADGVNSIIIGDDLAAADAMARIAISTSEREKMSAAAVERWAQGVSYSSDFRAACDELLGRRT
jgi:glycosyltransferase involved in cell wall biosynthesis